MTQAVTKFSDTLLHVTKKLKINGENAKAFVHSKQYLYFWRKYPD